MSAKRKARLPVLRPKPLGNGDEFLDRVSMAGVKPISIAADGLEPQISIVQTGRSIQRQPKDMYAIPQTISTLFEPEIKLVPKDKKWCSACGDWVDKKGFTADKRNRDGLQSHCKSCHAAHERKMYWLRKVEKQQRAA